MEKDALGALLRKHEDQKWIKIVKEYDKVRDWVIQSPMSEEIIVSQMRYLNIFLDDVGLNPTDFLALSGIEARDLTEQKCDEYADNEEHLKVNQVKYAVRSFYNFSHRKDAERIYFTSRHASPGCPS